MKLLRHLLLATTFLFFGASVIYAITNPENPESLPESGPNENDGPSCDCPPCDETSGSVSGGANMPQNKSIEWNIRVGLAQLPKPKDLSNFGKVAFESDGNLPDVAQLYNRFFPQNPLQQRQVRIGFSEPRIIGAIFHPSILRINSESIMEVLKIPGEPNSPEYIHQILTDDCFTVVDDFGNGEGWRIRVWKRNAAPLIRAAYSNYYSVAGFESVIPLNVVAFRPRWTGEDLSLVYTQSEHTGISGLRHTTNEITQVLDTSGRPETLSSAVYAGLDTSGALLSRENLIFSGYPPHVASSPPSWDHTIVREVYTASLDAAGTPGPLRLTRKTREDYDDFSVVSETITVIIHPEDPNRTFYIQHPACVIVPGVGLVYRYQSLKRTSGVPGMKRLMSSIEAYNMPGQIPQLTTYTYFTEIPPPKDIPTALMEVLESLNNFTITIDKGVTKKVYPPIPEDKIPLTYSRVKSASFPDGKWKYNEYVVNETSPVSIHTQYSNWKDVGMADRANALKTVTTVSKEELLVESYIAGELVSRLKNTLQTTPEIITTTQRWNSDGWHISKVAYHPIATNVDTAVSSGRINWKEHEDGTASIYLYSNAGDGNGGDFAVTVQAGAGNRSSIIAGTQTTTTYALGSIPIAEITKDIPTNLITEQWDTDLTAGFDAIARPVKRIFNGDINDYDIKEYACCGLQKIRYRNGSIAEYFRDGLRRIYKKEFRASDASPIITTHYTIDGLTTTSTRSIGGQSFFQGSFTGSFDGLTHTNVGPSEKSNSSSGRPSTTSATVQSQTGDTITVTDAVGATSVTAYYRDGRIKSVSGTAVPDVTYDYQARSTTVNASGVTTNTYMDFIGRPTSSVSSATGTTTYSYYLPTVTVLPGSRGKYKSKTDADGVIENFEYNNKGEYTTTRRTVPTGTGNQTQAVSSVRNVIPNVAIHGVSLGVCHKTTQTISSTIGATTTSETFVSLDGLSRGSRSFGREVLIVSTRPNPIGVSTKMTIRPDSTKEVITHQHGLLISNSSLMTNQSQVTNTSYYYDTSQRMISSVDARTGTTNYSNFTESGRPLTTTNPRNEVTVIENDILGREIKRTLPDTTSSYTSYHPTGEIKATWGSQTYPTLNLYDEQNRMTQLRTFKDLPLSSLSSPSLDLSTQTNFAKTTWNYGATTGLLVSKRDNSIQGPSYTYTAAGRLKSRTGARGIITTYTYNQGFLTLTDYSDTTPDVAISYDSLGRQATVTQTNQSQIAYTYDPVNLALDTETVKYDIDGNGVYEFIRVLDRSRDSLNRDNGFQLKNGTTVENQATYSYSAVDGRMDTVSGGGFQPPSPSNTFTYSYLPNSDLLASVSGPIHTVTNTYEPDRDVLDIKENKIGTLEISKYDYAVNSIGQRTGVATSGTAFDPTVQTGWTWGYDSLGQVISANSSSDAYDRAYQYDSIGNWKKSANRLLLPSTNTHISNHLNQYTSITGTDAASKTYDLDGNATAYPLPISPSTNGALTWDAENRLISTTRAATSGGFISYYRYDAGGRRIARISVNGSFAGTATFYLYDGWNCIAEYNKSAATPPVIALEKTYLWGTDLSGTLQGAGGVGGLLSQTKTAGAVTHFPNYDGNGNIGTYLTTTGGIAAYFEYDPFGNPLVNTDNTNQFAYRFSTKPRDRQTGLYYYGYRYYDPYTGRWLGRDPIGEDGGVNLYGFIYNNPNDLIDRLGLEPMRGQNGGGSNDRGGKDGVSTSHGGTKADDKAEGKRPSRHSGDKEKDPCPKDEPEPETKGEKQAREAREKAEREAKEYRDRNGGTGEGGTTGQPTSSGSTTGGLTTGEKVAAGVVAGYWLYRGVRMLPSLAPPLWPTIPANLAIP